MLRMYSESVVFSLFPGLSSSRTTHWPAVILFQASAEPGRHIVEEPLEGWEPYHLENHSLAAEGKVEKLKKEEQPFTITIAADKKRRFWGVKDRQRVREKIVGCGRGERTPTFLRVSFRHAQSLLHFPQSDRTEQASKSVQSHACKHIRVELQIHG